MLQQPGQNSFLSRLLPVLRHPRRVRERHEAISNRHRRRARSGSADSMAVLPPTMVRGQPLVRRKRVLRAVRHPKRVRPRPARPEVPYVVEVVVGDFRPAPLVEEPTAPHARPRLGQRRSPLSAPLFEHPGAALMDTPNPHAPGQRRRGHAAPTADSASAFAFTNRVAATSIKCFRPASSQSRHAASSQAPSTEKRRAIFLTSGKFGLDRA